MTSFTSSLLLALRNANVRVYFVNSRKDLFFFLKLLVLPLLPIYCIIRSKPIPLVYVNSSIFTFYIGALLFFFNIFGYKTILSVHHGYQGQFGTPLSSRYFSITNNCICSFLRSLISPCYIFSFSESQLLFFSNHRILSLAALFNTTSYISSSFISENLSLNTPILPSNIQSFFLSSSNTVKFIVSGYGKKYSLFEDVLLAAQICKLPISILVLAYGSSDINYMKSIRRLVDSTNDKIKILLIEQTFDRHTFLSLLQNFDVYIRSSSVDSYCYTISEAIDMGLLTIATNICNRDPRIPYLYTPGDLLRLSSVMIDIINSARVLSFPSSLKSTSSSNVATVPSLLISLMPN